MCCLSCIILKNFINIYVIKNDNIIIMKINNYIIINTVRGLLLCLFFMIIYDNLKSSKLFNIA